MGTLVLQKETVVERKNINFLVFLAYFLNLFFNDLFICLFNNSLVERH